MARLVARLFRPVGRTILVTAFLASLMALGQLPAHATPRASASLPTLNWPGMVAQSFFSTLDPAQSVETGADSFIATINASLIKRLPSGKLVPYIASKWTVSKNHKVYLFFLRHDVRFSNGDRLTAQDVVFSLRRLLAPATASPLAATSTILGSKDYTSGKTTALPGVRAVNTYEVRIESSEPTTSFLAGFSQVGAGIVLDHKVLAGKNASPKNNYLTSTCSGNIGAGPFKLVCQNNSSDQSSFFPAGSTPTLTVVPNPYFFGRHPKFRLVDRYIKDEQTAFLNFQAGQLDASGVPTSNIQQETGKKGFFHFPTFLVWYVSPAADVAPFDNIHCRLAVAYAMDTATVDKTVLHGAWAPLHSMEPKGVTGYYAGKDNPSFNPAKARSELAQCPGGIRGQKMVYQSTSSDFDNVFAGALPALFANVGIDIKGDGVPGSAWLKDATSSQKANNIPILQSGLTINDPNVWCDLRKTGFVLNTADFSNAQYDSICAKAAATFNSAKQVKLYEKAEHIAQSQGVYIPVGQVRSFAIEDSRVSGLVGDPDWVQIEPKDFDWANVTVK
jgi:ABC-type transport system substrate-binding protein